MDFMSIVREKASVLAHGVVKTSGAVVETVKSNLAITDKEVETTKIFRELGSLMYDAYKDGSEIDAGAQVKIVSIEGVKLICKSINN